MKPGQEPGKLGAHQNLIIHAFKLAVADTHFLKHFSPSVTLLKTLKSQERNSIGTSLLAKGELATKSIHNGEMCSLK